MTTRFSAFRQSALIEIFLILGSIILGAVIYFGVRNTVIQLAEASLEQSSFRVARRLERKLANGDAIVDLQVDTSQLKGFRDDHHRVLTVIDLEGRCAIHLRNPELVGKLILQGGLIDSETGLRPSFRSIHNDQDPIVGRFITSDGERQIVALAPMANLEYLVCTYSPMYQLLAEFHRIAVPAAVIWCAFSLVFLPWVLFGRRRAMASMGDRLSRILNEIPDVVWSTKGNPPVLDYVSPGCLKMTGFTAKELKSSRTFLRSRVDDADQDRYKEAIWALASGRVVTEEFRFHRRDGEIIWISFWMSPTLDSKGVLVGADGVCSDVTRRKRAEIALRKAEQHYRSLVEHVDMGLIRVSPSNELIYMSPQVERMSGCRNHEFKGDPEILNQTVFPADREKLKLFRDARINLRPGPVEAELRFRDRNGKLGWVFQRQIPVTNEMGEIQYYDMVVMDITKRKTLESQLEESKRLEMLGNLAAGVAHDFNNILTVISATTELMESSLATRQEIGPNLEELRRATDQAGDMVRSLLTFGQKRRLRQRDCDLNAIVNDGMRVIRRVMPESIEIRMDLADDLDLIRGDSGQLQHALLNLCLHAKEAMPDGGQLKISTRMTTIEARQAAVRPEIQAGLCVVLQIKYALARSAHRVAKEEGEVLPRNKGAESLPEFGLAMVYQIVRQHAGWVDVLSEEEGEAKVTVYLPVSETLSLDRTESFISGTEQVLVVDHEQMIAGFIKTVLEQRGYKVEAVDGIERALDQLSSQGTPFSAVIIDSKKGDLGKLTSLQRLRESHPGLGAILIGGGQPDHALLAELDHPMTTFLEKPFQATDLAACIRVLLDQKTAKV